MNEMLARSIIKKLAIQEKGESVESVRLGMGILTAVLAIILVAIICLAVIEKKKSIEVRSSG
jgi:hypothetical protein